MKIYKLLLIGVAIFGVSCNSGIDAQLVEKDPTEQDGQTPKLSYTIQTIYDLSLIFDIEASYVDINGDIVSEAVESLPWSVTIDNFERAQDVTLELTFVVKDDFESSKTSYTFGSQIELSYLDTSGSYISKSNDSSFTTSSSQIEAAIEMYTLDGIDTTLTVKLP